MNGAKAYMGRVADMGCIVCRRLGFGFSPAEVHHLRGNGWGRASDFDTIPLCYPHHRGADGIHHLGVRAWERRFWTQAELLAKVRDELLGCSHSGGSASGR